MYDLVGAHLVYSCCVNLYLIIADLNRFHLKFGGLGKKSHPFFALSSGFRNMESIVI